MSEPQHATLSAESKRASLHGELRVTNTGLLAIGALVSSILLSSAVIVHTALARRREKGC